MRKIIWVLCFCFLAVASSYAKSVIYLKDGDKVEGDIIERDNDYIKINLEGIELTYWSDQIEKIEEGRPTGTPSMDTAVKPSSQRETPSDIVKPQEAAVEETVVIETARETPTETGEEKPIAVDGSDQDWAEALFVFDEVGEILPADSDRLDVKRLYLAADNSYLYFLVNLNQDISDFFIKNEDSSSSFIAEIYLDTDNNAQTGCDDVKLFRYGVIKGYDYEITVSAGMKETDGAVEPFVSYGVLVPTQQRNSFYMKDAGYRSTSLDQGTMIHFKDNNIEFAIPLVLLNIHRDLPVRSIVIECAKMAGNRFVFIVKEGSDLSVFDTLKVIEAERAQKQEQAPAPKEIPGVVPQGAVSNGALKEVSEYQKSKGLGYGEAAKPADIAGMLGPLFLFYLFFSLCLQVIAIKTKMSSSWMAWVPIVNFVLMCKIASKPLWWVIMLFLPLVNIVFVVLLWMAIAEACNKPSWLGICMVLPGLNIIVLAYLAFFK